MDLVSGFPKNLAYTLKKLENFTKQTVKVLPDRVNSVQFGEVSRFKLPAGALIDTTEGVCSCRRWLVVVVSRSSITMPVNFFYCGGEEETTKRCFEINSETSISATANEGKKK